MKSIDSLVEQVMELKKNGLSESEISDELHLSVATVTWLLTQNVKVDKPPADIKVGWKSIAVYGNRIGMMSSLFSDIILEEMESRDIEDLDTVVGIAINGIPFASMISEQLGVELSIFRPPITEEGKGTFCSNYATLKDKNVVIVDDVISTGSVARRAISACKTEGANPILMVVMVNKTPVYELEDTPIRSLIRARPIA
jgi:orotate phosphoribosyltransferase